jgi:hypothetical protein
VRYSAESIRTVWLIVSKRIPSWWIEVQRALLVRLFESFQRRRVFDILSAHVASCLFRRERGCCELCCALERFIAETIKKSGDEIKVYGTLNFMAISR